MGLLTKLTEVLEHPDEFWPLVHMLMAAQKAKRLPQQKELAFCYSILNNVSRSFAIVIQQLPEELRDAICVFYLVLRALDTVEDDMSIPIDEKCDYLKRFDSLIGDTKLSLAYGSGEYKRLLKEYGNVAVVYNGLKKEYQAVIRAICKRMGDGMAKYIQQEVETIQQYDEYCHYVAGLVGEGLSRLFTTSGLETIGDQKDLSNHMGLFLQKTNIIRDYLEDINEEPRPRMFWPKEVWGKYGKTLEDFKHEGNRSDAVKCLNHLITDALRHAPHSLRYMQLLQNQQVFRFCAIPQIMAIGTLAECYNNPRVFAGVVKMRRGQTAKVFDTVNSLDDVHRYFDMFADVLEKKAQRDAQSDPSYKRTMAALTSMRKLCVVKHSNVKPAPRFTLYDALLVLPLVVLMLVLLYAWSIGRLQQVLGI